MSSFGVQPAQAELMVIETMTTDLYVSSIVIAERVSAQKGF